MQNRHSPIAALTASLRPRLGRVFLPCAALLLAFASSASSFAQSAASTPVAIKSSEATKAAVSVKLTQRKVIKSADGKEQLVDATTVKPGDVLEYRVTYVNNSAKTVTGLIGELPIPQGLEYQRKSAKPGNSQHSQFKAATKEGVFAAEPLMRKVGSVQQEVPYSEYRKLNWTLGQLLAGSEVSVSARAQVQTYIAPSAGQLLTPQAPPISVVRVPAPAKP